MNKKVDWKLLSTDESLVGATLTDAKDRDLKWYKNVCGSHGVTTFLVSDNTCLLCRRDQMKKRRTEYGDVKLFHNLSSLIQGCKRRAISKKLSFDLCLTTLRSVVPKWCPILGIRLHDSRDIKTGENYSLDRVDCTKGYLMDNVEWMSQRANRLKSDGSIDEHLLIAIHMMQQKKLTEEQMEHRLKRMIDFHRNIDKSTVDVNLDPLKKESKRLKAQTARFIERAKSIHGERYSYDQTEYINPRTKLTITCATHGPWLTTPHNHINGNKSGCPECAKITRKTRRRSLKV